MTGFTAVLLYAAWMPLLTLVYAGFRVPLILTMRKRADSWTRGRTIDDPPFIVRAHHAHLNCVENFPVFAAVVIVAALMGKSPIVDRFAATVLYARIGQSAVHLIGTSFALIMIRATLFVIQLGLILYMIWGLLA